MTRRRSTPECYQNRAPQTTTRAVGWRHIAITLIDPGQLLPSRFSATMIGRLTGGQMTNLGAVIQQLREERTRVESELAKLNRAILVLENTEGSGSHTRPSGRRTLSQEARERIAEAQRRRWAKTKGVTINPKKRTLSPAARRRIVAAQKARWAKFRAKKH